MTPTSVILQVVLFWQVGSSTTSLLVRIGARVVACILPVRSTEYSIQRRKHLCAKIPGHFLPTACVRLSGYSSHAFAKEEVECYNACYLSSQADCETPVPSQGSQPDDTDCGKSLILANTSNRQPSASYRNETSILDVIGSSYCKNSICHIQRHVIPSQHGWILLQVDGLSFHTGWLS